MIPNPGNWTWADYLIAFLRLGHGAMGASLVLVLFTVAWFVTSRRDKGE